MRALSTAVSLAAVLLLPSAANAAERGPRVAAAISGVEDIRPVRPTNETYRGYYVDLSSIEAQPNLETVRAAVRHQIDMAEDSKVSPRVLEFFHTVPIVVDEFDCMQTLEAKATGAPVHAAACYAENALDRVPRKSNAISVWDSSKSQWTNLDPVGEAEDTKTGVVMIRPNGLSNPQRPVVLHELLHAYHYRVMPQGFEDRAIKFYYEHAKDQHFYPADSYLLSNQKEFFAVTASVFLYGEDLKLTRAYIKEKQPDYYSHLVWLFGFDPDPAPATARTSSVSMDTTRSEVLWSD